MICANPRKTPLALILVLYRILSNPALYPPPSVSVSALEAAQAPQHLRDPDTFRLSPPPTLAIPFVQHFRRGCQDLARDAVRGVRVLGEFVDSVCESVDGWFEGGGDGADAGRWC